MGNMTPRVGAPWRVVDIAHGNRRPLILWLLIAVFLAVGCGQGSLLDPGAGDGNSGPPPPPPATGGQQLFYECLFSNGSGQWTGNAVGCTGSVGFSHAAMVNTLSPGGGTSWVSEGDGVFNVDFPGQGGCSGAMGDDGFPACNGMVAVVFDTPIAFPVWVRIVDRLSAGWVSGVAYKWQRWNDNANSQPGLGIWEDAVGCAGALWFARSNDGLCLGDDDWEGQWNVWDIHLLGDAVEVFRNNELVHTGPEDSAANLAIYQFGANLNHNPPSPQIRSFDYLAISRDRLPQ